MDDILYHFTLSYPWKKLLRGLTLITICILAILLPFFMWDDYKRGVLFDLWNTIFYVILVGVVIILEIIMRYVLIHLDKIKAPIEVWLDKYEVHYTKGNFKKDFQLEGLKSVRVVLNDRKVMLETNYEKDSDWEKGWKVAFKRKNELELVDYKEFIEKTFLPFTEVVIRRLKELNPRIKVVKEDRRKKYR